jgi:hypothetical protein
MTDNGPRSLPERYCRCTSIIGLANPDCQVHGNRKRQDSLFDQLASVVRKANEMGCYDAADWISRRVNEGTRIRAAIERAVHDPATKPGWDR